MRRWKAFDPFLGNMLEIISSHHIQNESVVVFPMGELGRELSENSSVLHAGLKAQIPHRHLLFRARYVGKHGV